MKLSLIQFNQSLNTPITTIDEAKSFIQMLHDNNKMYLLEDDPRDIIYYHNGEQTFTPEQCDLLDLRVNEIYSFDFGAHTCPLGYYLDVVNPNLGYIPDSL
jgi:hypothetical protein